MLGDSLIVDAQPEAWTQMQKRLRVTLRPEDVEVQIGIKNTGAWAVQCAAWGISACAPGSTVVFAGSSEDTGYLPNRSLIIWPYTKMQDARMQFFDAYHVVHLSLIHISEPTRQAEISYAVFCLKKKN